MNYNWDWAMFFKPTGIGSEIYLDWFVSGLGWTIAIALAAWVIALLLGSLLGVLRTVPNRWVAGIATAYVEIFRNVPLLLWILVILALFTEVMPTPRDYRAAEDGTTSAQMILFGTVAPTNRYTAVPAVVAEHGHQVR